MRMNRRDLILELAKRCERSSGEDRELDCEIAVAVHGGEIVWKQANYTMESYPARKYSSINHSVGFGFAPVERFTSSLDAFLPTEDIIGVSEQKGYNNTSMGWVAIHRMPPGQMTISSCANTEILARRAVALRALALNEEDEK